MSKAIKIAIACVFFLLFVAFFFFANPILLQNREKPVPIPTPEKKAESPFKYRILEDIEQNETKTLMVLISPQTNSFEVQGLAKFLKKKFDDFDYLTIDIFDSIEAFFLRNDPTYPENAFLRHWLVRIRKNQETNRNEIFVLDKSTGKFVEF